MERRDVDVNITPDKRQVMVNNETILRLALKKSLLKTFGNIPSTFKVENQTLTDLFAYKQIKSDNNRSEAIEESPSDVSMVEWDVYSYHFISLQYLLVFVSALFRFWVKKYS